MTSEKFIVPISHADISKTLAYARSQYEKNDITRLQYGRILSNDKDLYNYAMNLKVEGKI